MRKGKLLLLMLVGSAAVAQGADWTELNERARVEALEPVKPGVPGKSPFWNVKARAFTRPPAFDFKSVEGAKSYRFTVTEKAGGAARSFVADRPWASLKPVWGEIPPGYVTVKCEGLAADGAVLGVAGTRECYRAAFFKGPYPQAANRDYAGAAHRCFAAVYRLPYVQGWLAQDTPPEGYDLYCYPSKLLSAMIEALLRFAGRAPSADAEKAVTIACRMADWLIAQSQPKGAPLEYLPPTYWGNRRGTAVQYAGMNMLLYPVNAANAYFRLFEKTGAVRYRDAGIRIAETMRRLQNQDGTWWLKVYEKDGRPVRANRLVTRGEFDHLFAKAAELTGDRSFVSVAEKARRYESERIHPDWNWDGQFEDVDPLPLYHNLTKHNACDFAGWLFDHGRMAEARELLAWTEDQFVVWSDPIHHMDWQNWKMPTALEQYEYYTPIDASMARFIEHFAKAYRATRDDLYLEKARALADCVLRHQRADGTIPTYFDTRKGSDWVNCMVYTAICLERLAQVLQPDDGARFFESGIETTPVTAVRTETVAGKAASALPPGKKWKLVWHDEFDGKEVDRTKWMCRESFWGQDFPAFAHDFEGVEMTGETVKMHLLRKGDDFTSPHLQTGSLTYDIPRDTAKGFWPFGSRKTPLFMHRYGYWEVRCRLPKFPGWHAAFWIQAPGVGSHPDPAVAGTEIDVMENYSQHVNGKIVGGNGWGGYGRQSCWFRHFKWTHEETVDGWHTYGVDWSPSGYVFYCDGKKVGEQNYPVSHIEEFVLISTEPGGYRKVSSDGGLTAGRDARVWGKPDPRLFDAKLPDFFEVDYVRVYDDAAGYAPPPKLLPLVSVAKPAAGSFKTEFEKLRREIHALVVAGPERRMKEYPRARILELNARAAALLELAKDETSIAVLRSAQISCAKAMDSSF